MDATRCGTMNCARVVDGASRPQRGNQGGGRRAIVVLGLLLLLGNASQTLSAERFGYAKQTIGLSVGYGQGFFQIGAGSAKDLNFDVEVVNVIPQWTIGINNPLAEGTWYRGNFDLVVEAGVLINTDPSGLAAGLQALPRYNFLGWREDIVPFVEGGAGITFLDYDLRRQRDGFNFATIFGLGVHILVSERLAVTPRLRFQHISNADTRRPDNGIDTIQFLLGASYSLSW